jgi:hypothetical protein
MSTTKNNSRRGSKKSLSSSNVLIRPAKRSEFKRFDQLLEDYHYIGKSRSVGDSMRMIAEIDGGWVGLLMWGSACYRIKDRDNFIGWTDVQRAQRQKLVVQNRRFSLLFKPGKHPNLASKILGAAIRALPGLWFDKFGYQPLIAETFTDIEAYKGTCYKASGWLPLGLSKGFSRHRDDFYVPNERPKKLWVRLLDDKACELLRSPSLPAEYTKGAKSDDYGVSPLKTKEMNSLYWVLRSIPDPRTSNKTYHIGSILSIVAMAVFSGHRNLAQIVRFGKRMNQAHRKAIGLRRYKKNSTFLNAPSYKVYYNLLAKLDVDAFAESLSGWLNEHRGSLPAALALDGKFIKDTVGVVCLVDHETGVPVAMTKASKKEGDTGDCEMVAAKKMIENQSDLSNTLITADALHTQRETAQQIVANGGEYILQVKGNQKNLKKNSELKTDDLTPFLKRRKKGMEE